ncbi:MAG: hypothetical protein ACI83I_000750 [Bacteroidia bacterium]|jgi:hypothetical protein
MALFFSPKLALAQYAEIRGQILAPDDTELEGVYIQLLSDGETKYITASDEAGNYQIKQINPGKYTLLATTVSSDSFMAIMSIQKQEIFNFVIENDVALKPIVIRIASEPTSGFDSLPDLPSIDPTQIILIKPGVKLIDGELVVGPNRPGSTSGMSDGNIPMLGPMPPTVLGLENIAILDQAIPARYGGFSGGGIQFRSRVISTSKVNTIQLQSSSPFNGYHHNLLSLYTSRALISREYDNKGSKKLVLGYSFLAHYQFQKDPSPAAGTTYTGTDQTIQHLTNNPLTSSEIVGGYVPAANFIRTSDLKTTDARPNAQRHDGYAQLKLTFNPTPNIGIDFIQSYNYVQRRLALNNNVLLNRAENPEQQAHFYNGQINFSHALKSKYNHLGERNYERDHWLSNLFYAVELNYQTNSNVVQSANHQDDYFSYGYVGAFNTKRIPVYGYTENQPITYTDENGKQHTVKNYMELTGYRDSLMSFTPDARNAGLSAYTQFLFDKQNGQNSMSKLVQGGGILNGYNLPLIYSLYALPGTVYGSYNKSFEERFGITAYTEAAIHPFNNQKIQHDVEFGVNFIQDKSGYYGLSAARLWQIMPQLVNSHINPLDRNNPTLSFDEQGRFIDSVRYAPGVQGSQQTHFDAALRQKLIQSGYTDADGQKINESSWIDVNSLSPETFDLSMFSADELLNNGNGYVSYSGYDHLGNRTKGRSGIGQFLNNPQNRTIDAFAPIRGAAWLQDKFVYKNLIVRMGFRFERYDGNQYVLKDPFLINPAHTAGEVSELQGLPVHHPGSIESDYVVYVNDFNSPTNIVGYRNGTQWYDADGNTISDPSLLANKSSSGRIQPYLIDPENQELSTASFRTSNPQNLILPRLSFSFPINSTSLLFVSYDKLAQQPAASQTYLPYSTYYFMQSNISGVLPNPDMKPRVKTDYNIGLSQLIGAHASMKLVANYAQLSNDFNQYRIEQAYPYSYTTYSNIDVATIQQYTVEFNHMDNHLTLNGSYSMQFAEGTGSNVNSAASLIQSGQPNLRSLYPLSFENRHTFKGYVVYNFGREKSYQGPKGWAESIFENTFLSATLNASSGNPYTSIQAPITGAQAANGVVQRSQIKGNPFGNRMPWATQVDLRIEKGIMVNEHNMIRMYVSAANLLNTLLIRNVYSFTGLPSDDGYLNSPVGQQQVRNQIDAETFTQLYKIRLDNPNNFGSPRNIQIGLKMDF